MFAQPCDIVHVQKAKRLVEHLFLSATPRNAVITSQAEHPSMQIKFEQNTN